MVLKVSSNLDASANESLVVLLYLRATPRLSYAYLASHKKRDIARPDPRRGGWVRVGAAGGSLRGGAV